MMMMMFVLENLEIKRPRRLSAKERAANLLSIALIKSKWDMFDNETRIRAAKTIRCLETQGLFR
jgi:hypothetical protein